MSTLFGIFGSTVAYFIGLPVFILWFLMTLGTNSTVQKPKLLPSDGLFNTKLGAGQSFLVLILVVSLVAICERVLFDLSRTIVGVGYDYFDNLQTIMVHAVFIVPLFAVFIVINILVGQHRKKYAVILMPYFVTTIILVVQLIAEISTYFSNHHTKAELYVVLMAIVFIASYAVWYVQELYNRRLEKMR